MSNTEFLDEEGLKTLLLELKTRLLNKNNLNKFYIMTLEVVGNEETKLSSELNSIPYYDIITNDDSNPKITFSTDIKGSVNKITISNVTDQTKSLIILYYRKEDVVSG